MRNIRQRIKNHWFYFFPPKCNTVKISCGFVQGKVIEFGSSHLYQSHLQSLLWSTRISSIANYVCHGQWNSALHLQVLALFYLQPYFKTPYFIFQLWWAFQRSCCKEANTADSKSEGGVDYKHTGKQCIQIHFKGETESHVYMELISVYLGASPGCYSFHGMA